MAIRLAHNHIGEVRIPAMSSRQERAHGAKLRPDRNDDCRVDITGFSNAAEAGAVYASHIDHGPHCLLWLAALAYESCGLQDE
ncbi:hypothetical protein D5S18_08030 [Nocardia panacis]|uniref:Uncharacterized protein n=2 Tax=Nocardia panacis TaxID=2340916 RepID=A0A3A4L580_9NOCA|nr:hypothetical protein D5S18_08030 [Nocardia panacis]